MRDKTMIRDEVSIVKTEAGAFMLIAQGTRCVYENEGEERCDEDATQARFIDGEFHCLCDEHARMFDDDAF